MTDEPPFAYDLYACPHDCGFMGETDEFDRVVKKDYSRDIYECPQCERRMKI